MHQLNANSQNEPRFPQSVVVAGVIWIVLGVLGVLSAVGLLLDYRGSFDSSLTGIDGNKFLSAFCGGPILLLFGVLFLLAGFRVTRCGEGNAGERRNLHCDCRVVSHQCF